MLRGFTCSPASVLPWAEFLAECGHSNHVPRLPGHGTHWREMNDTTWHDWYAAAEPLIRRVSALRLLRATLKPKRGYAQPPLFALPSLSPLLHEIKPCLAKIEMPILLIRSIQDHVISASSSELVLREAKSPDKELVMLENSFHVATLDYDSEIIIHESLRFTKRLEDGANIAAETTHD